MKISLFLLYICAIGSCVAETDTGATEVVDFLYQRLVLPPEQKVKSEIFEPVEYNLVLIFQHYMYNIVRRTAPARQKKATIRMLYIAFRDHLDVPDRFRDMICLSSGSCPSLLKNKKMINRAIHQIQKLLEFSCHVKLFRLLLQCLEDTGFRWGRAIEDQLRNQISSEALRLKSIFGERLLPVLHGIEYWYLSRYKHERIIKYLDLVLNNGAERPISSGEYYLVLDKPQDLWGIEIFYFKRDTQLFVDTCLKLAAACQGESINSIHSASKKLSKALFGREMAKEFISRVSKHGTIDLGQIKLFSTEESTSESYDITDSSIEVEDISMFWGEKGEPAVFDLELRDEVVSFPVDL